MAIVKPHRISLIGDQSRHEEHIAAAIIKPGQLLKLDLNGKVIPHGTAGGPAEAAFALEDALQGRTIDDAYAVGELVGITMCKKGDVIYGFLSVGESVTPADFLSSNGDGSMQKHSGTQVALAVPLETLDLSDSESADGRIRFRII